MMLPALNAQVSVRGYFRSDGTYVEPHYRSKPDASPFNNWSYPGNVNPYTGKVARGNPDTYLKKYRSRRSYSNDYTLPIISVPSTPPLKNDWDLDIDSDWP